MDTFLDGLKLCDKYLYGYNNSETEKTEKGVLQKCDMGDDLEKGKGLGTPSFFTSLENKAEKK